MVRSRSGKHARRSRNIAFSSLLLLALLLSLVELGSDPVNLPGRRFCAKETGCTLGNTTSKVIVLICDKSEGSIVHIDSE